ncbi:MULTISPECIES: GNAT family N-acetyltransferase [unclassified Pseudomonas]|uniref:GNAT family N-acetyltransferase n=1 Tax=unclassified Pseudomonas TaxID=196821 RepID=UPI000DA7C8BE|nr:MULTISPECIES: GNAT family N-acetyltransferase [unclassified Pseudomonas]MDW3711394.1 GNAT family N-acetyltransferase [Pseudomonas sp. 2023EL-01195]PZE12845.1 GNAT family N-acetyltransferase [Pseudomonas sp. 57B-090624]
MEYLIRTATPDDAAAISQVVLTALAESNARDYPPKVIASVQANFGPEQVRGLLAAREVLVAEAAGCVIGTASLDGDMVRTVFVAPGAQGLGVGRRLMEQVEALARERGVAVLKVPSSITAEGFYAGLGFQAVQQIIRGEERTIVMERSLAAAQPG